MTPGLRNTELIGSVSFNSAYTSLTFQSLSLSCNEVYLNRSFPTIPSFYLTAHRLETSYKRRKVTIRLQQMRSKHVPKLLWRFLYSTGVRHPLLRQLKVFGSPQTIFLANYCYTHTSSLKGKTSQNSIQIGRNDAKVVRGRSNNTSHFGTVSPNVK
jgi:hypothetical protein